MATWTGVVTNAGKALFATWLDGTTFNVDAAEGGTGTVPEASLLAQTALASKMQDISIIAGERVADGIKVTVQIAAPAVGYTLNQIGMKCSVDGGTKTLTALFQSMDGVSIPAVTQTPDFIYKFFGTIQVSNTGSFSLTIDTSAIVSQSTLDAAIAAHDSAAASHPDMRADIIAAALSAADAQKTANDALEAAKNNAGGCIITISFDADFSGRAYTVTGGAADVHTGTVPSSLVVEIKAKNVNTTYTISSTVASGTSYTATCLTGPYFGQYAAELTTFDATLTVTAESGAAVTATSASRSYTGTAGSGGTCVLSIKTAGTYSIVATKNGASSSQATAAISASGSFYAATVRFIVLTVTVDNGSVVTATNGTTTRTATSTGTAVFYLPNVGTWEVAATLGTEAATGSVDANTYSAFSLRLSYVAIFGVMWNYANTSTALTRLTADNDPNREVTEDVPEEPIAAVQTGSGRSHFDQYLPWSGMEEYNVIGNAVTYKRGETGFSRTANDTVVYIPEFYVMVVDDAGASKRYFYVADKPKTGFVKHPGSGRYVGKYNTGAAYVSKSGLAPLASVARSTARAGSAAKGANWWQVDLATWNAIQVLYLVEYADWDSQVKIGRGVVDVLAATSNGMTDTMTYHTGQGGSSVQYRWVENLWGNVYEHLDGVNFSERTAYICTDPSAFADDTAVGYTTTGIKLPATNGYIAQLGFSVAFPWALLPSASGGSDSTYIPDNVVSNTGWRGPAAGGSWSNGSIAGLFFLSATQTATSNNASNGARLMFVP